jgi:hypothetical protein
LPVEKTFGANFEMSRKETALALCAGSLVSLVLGSSYAAATSIRPAMQIVVTCSYNMVRSKPGLLSVEVYAVGTEKYVIEYTFRDKGRTFTGGIGIHDGIDSDGTYMYTNDTPSGQPDDDGGVELNFLGNTIEEMYGKCHLMPGLDDTIKLPGTPDPVWQKIDLPKQVN